MNVYLQLVISRSYCFWYVNATQKSDDRVDALSASAGHKFVKKSLEPTVLHTEWGQF